MCPKVETNIFNYCYNNAWINTFGIRMRHEVCERWINGKKDMNHIMEHLKDANFDPEFYKQYENQIVDQYNQENRTSLKSKKRDWKRIFAKN